jgi:RNA ligase
MQKGKFSTEVATHPGSGRRERGRKLINFDLVQKEIETGYIAVQRHPTENLRILNYTAKAQYDQRWTDEVKICRGLIVDGDNQIVARPFAKFFNADQHQRSDLVWSKPFTVTEKLDGSLGILYKTANGLFIATRGSFTSEQANRATEILHDRYLDIVVPDGLTPLFEIIYPSNRVVVDYGDLSDLILLTVIDNQTGADAACSPQEAAKLINWSGRVAQSYPIECKPTDVIAALGLPQDGSVEGIVLRFDYPKGQHTRIKVKTDEYKRLHKLITGVNARHIWEALRDGLPLEPLIERVPDEYYQWVKATEKELRTAYAEIEMLCQSDYKGLRKAIAQYFQTCAHPGVLFSMLDGKDYSNHIWKQIRPQAARAFRCDGESESTP